jgi:hypothetical protein
MDLEGSCLVVVESRYCLAICLEVLKKTTEKLFQYSWCPGQDIEARTSLINM